MLADWVASGAVLWGYGRAGMRVEIIGRWVWGACDEVPDARGGCPCTMVQLRWCQCKLLKLMGAVGNEAGESGQGGDAVHDLRRSRLVGKLSAGRYIRGDEAGVCVGNKAELAMAQEVGLDGGENVLACCGKCGCGAFDCGAE